MLTLRYVIPLSGTRRGGRSWTIDKVNFEPLAAGAIPPDETLVKACHAAMRGEDNKRVAVDVLRTFDLKAGLAAAFRAVGA